MRSNEIATCSSCHVEPARVGQRYCLACHARHMREHRPKHSELPPQARQRANTRAYANVYQQRGKLIPKPCEECGAIAQKHHDDYRKPLKVRWLCREHHLAHHREAA